MPAFDPFGYGRQFRAIAGQISNLTHIVTTIGAKIMSGQADAAAAIANLQSTVSNEVASTNAGIQRILNAVKILQDPNSDDAAWEAAANQINAVATQIGTSQQAMGDAVAQLPALPVTPPPVDTPPADTPPAPPAT